MLSQPKPVRRMFKSTLFWLFILLFVVDVTIMSVRPLKYVTSLKYIPLDQNSMVSKIPEFFDSTKHPDVLVLGSSMPMWAIAIWDATFTHAACPSWEEVRRYSGARYLESQLAKTLGTSGIFNLTCPACMASDAYLLLSRAIDAGKAPKIVIWGIAARDFVDNTTPPLGKTPVYQVLADWRCLSDFTSGRAGPDEVRDFIISTLWYYYKVKADYRTLITTVTADVLGHPDSMYAASIKQKPPSSAASTQVSDLPNPQPATQTKPAQANPLPSAFIEQKSAPLKSSLTSGQKPSAIADKQEVDAELDDYRKRYNPPNFRRLEEEAVFLEKTIRLCQQNKIKLVILNMPITRRNRQLLNPNLEAAFYRKICSLAQKEADVFIDLSEDKVFDNSDFQDSVHTNSKGGKKVQDRLLAAVNRLKPI